MKNVNVFKITSILIGVIGFIIVIPIPILLVMGTLGFGDSITDSQIKYAFVSFCFTAIITPFAHLLLSE
tara:strand:- start:183 stop:389 length:207 start_codon:yes stop_codon:yes gene_type:complete